MRTGFFCLDTVVGFLDHSVIMCVLWKEKKYLTSETCTNLVAPQKSFTKASNDKCGKDFFLIFFLFAVG